jgi:hypothetical protein
MPVLETKTGLKRAPFTIKMVDITPSGQAPAQA